MNRDEALATLHRVALHVVEHSQTAAVERLLERLSVRDDAEELRAALVLAGAAAVLSEASQA